MAKKQYILSIQNPCSENWDEMTPEAQGRFCTHCQKTVIDFTTLSNKEIIKIIEQNKDNLFGRLRADQQNIPIIAESKTFRIHFPKIAAASLLFLGLASREADAQKVSSPTTQNPDKAQGSSKTIHNNTNELIIIKGYVFDDRKQAAEGAIVKVFDKKKII